MSSERQIRANRANARASCGPKSRRGKARASRNALRHGLNVPLYVDPELASEVEILAQRICATATDPDLLRLARPIAEAQLNLRRVREYRQRLIAQALADRNFHTDAAFYQLLRVARRFFATHRDAASREEFWNSPGPQPLTGPERTAAILAQFASELTALDRYERRALSRRKFAIRAFDAFVTQTQNAADGRRNWARQQLRGTGSSAAPTQHQE